MTAIMLYHVRSKYTAVGRKEIVLFFYMYMFVELLAIFLDSAIIPTAHAVYPVSLINEQSRSRSFSQWFTAVYAGALGALYWCILINGFVGFQFHEDGTPMSLWVSSPANLTECMLTRSFSACRVWSFGEYAFSSPLQHSSNSPRSHTQSPSVSSSPTSSSPPFVLLSMLCLNSCS